MLRSDVELNFHLAIDGEDVLRANADIFRLFELLKATIDIHAYNGSGRYHLTRSMFRNLVDNPKKP